MEENPLVCFVLTCFATKPPGTPEQSRRTCSSVGFLYRVCRTYKNQPSTAFEAFQCEILGMLQLRYTILGEFCSPMLYEVE